jgi:thiamine biosynthesis lipoprotein
VITQFASVSMDTEVNVQVVSHDQPHAAIERAVQHALEWFDTVERICTRFDTRSEVMQLVDRAGQPTPVSTLLFQVVSFALQLAEQTEGAFDPTIGATIEQLGFNINYKTGAAINSHLDGASGTFRDVHLDSRAQTILLERPLVLDLNAVAKGLAIDLAATELSSYANLCIEAGGDIYARGHNPAGQPWQIGIQHPRAEGLLARTLQVTDAAVCTSGDYERGSHILDARSHEPASDLASVTVIAPTAMAADGLSTAAMVLGRSAAPGFLKRHGVGGVLIPHDGQPLMVNL